MLAAPFPAHTGLSLFIRPTIELNVIHDDGLRYGY